ncbi:MAG: ABC transporter permease [bacterium]|nr:ABC transporter permease [bacterium]
MNTGLWAARAGFFVALLALWEGVARLGIWPHYLFPPPSDVLAALAGGLRDGLFVRGALASLWRVAVGYAIAVGLGTVLGVAIGRSRLLDATLGSLVLGFQALPSVCWLPLAILWFGLDERAIVFVVVMGALFSVTLGVEAGVKNLPPVYLRAARNLGAGGPSLYTQVILPAAQPAILAGLKQGWTFAWRSLMAAELLYYTLSLGNLLQGGRDLNDAARVMAVMLLIIGLGVTIDRGLFSPLERRLRERWGFGVA